MVLEFDACEDSKYLVEWAIQMTTGMQSSCSVVADRMAEQTTEEHGEGDDVGSH